MPAQHVFLFRHCLRSTYSRINLYDRHNQDEDDSSNFPTDLAEYIGVPLPEWNTPEGQCTETGLDILKGTGRYLLHDYLPSRHHENNKIDRLDVEFIADMMSQRDVDSAVALAQGMASIISQTGDDNKEIVSVRGLGNIKDDPDLFHPTQMTGFREDDHEPICSIPPETPASKAIKNDMLQSRLESISMPGKVNDVMDLIEYLGGHGKTAGPLRFIQPQLGINPDTSTLMGAILAVARIGEMAFLARASSSSGLASAAASSSSFFPRATVSDIYNLLAWHDWRKAVTDMNNNEAAMVGAVKVDRILNLLAGEAEDSKVEEDSASSNGHHHATFLIGHDDDIAAVATALGLTWMLPSPYRSGKSGEYSAIPPGAGLHFYHNPDDNANNKNDDASVHISVLAPVILSPEPSHSHIYGDQQAAPQSPLNTTGILEERSVMFVPSFAHAKQEGFTTRVGGASSAERSGIDLLRDRLHNILSSSYPDAMDCLQNVTSKRYDQNQAASSANNSRPSLVGDAGALVLALCFVVTGILVVSFGTKRLLSHPRKGISLEQQTSDTQTTKQTEMAGIIKSFDTEP